MFFKPTLFTSAAVCCCWPLLPSPFFPVPTTSSLKRNANADLPHSQRQLLRADAACNIGAQHGDPVVPVSLAEVTMGKEQVSRPYTPGCGRSPLPEGFGCAQVYFAGQK